MKLHFSHVFQKRSRKFYNDFFSAALLCVMAFSGSVHAHLPQPAISVNMVASDLFRDLRFADRNFGTHFNLSSSIIVDENDPVSAERADVYVGFMRPDGVPMTWADDPNLYVAALPTVGMHPLARNMTLSGGGFGLPINRGYLRYIFSPTDLPGIYQWFTLVVRAGKPVEDATQWLTFRTKMLPVK